MPYYVHFCISEIINTFWFFNRLETQLQTQKTILSPTNILNKVIPDKYYKVKTRTKPVLFE